MIRLEPDETRRILVIEMQGMISEADIDQCLDTLQERYPEVGLRLRGGTRGGLGLLLDWTRLEGWELGAKTVGTLTGKMISDVVRRVAVVADDKWRGERERIADAAKLAEVRLFAASQRQKALDWLSGG